ncbi:MAG TPA: helix-turn-helix domain-containing protein [Chloroflexota bacterium]|nr:helix-turn-helix domain-containing protein [Chloroflexota bacterium]
MRVDREGEKEERLAARGDRILDALATLITRWGYGKTTVDDVAREAGVAKGTVYLHWSTKDAMLHALLEREERQWNAVIIEHAAADPRGATISGIYRHALALSLKNPLLRALSTQDRDALGEWTRSPRSRARARRRMEGMHALIRAWRAAGWMRTDLSVEAQAYLLAALSYGILTIDAYLPTEFVPSSEEVLDAFAGMVRSAFEPDGAQAEEGRTKTAEMMIGLLRSLTAGQPPPGDESDSAPPTSRAPDPGDTPDKEKKR